MEGDLTWGGEHTIQYTDDVLQKCTPESCIILLTNVTPIHSIKMMFVKIVYKMRDHKPSWWHLSQLLTFPSLPLTLPPSRGMENVLARPREKGTQA